MIEVIGTTEDIKRGAIINFVWSQDGMHFISLDYGDGSDYKYIVRNTATSALLDFQRNKRIKANVVGDMLYWNDGYTSPHKVNIEKAIKYYLGEPWGYPYLTDAVISAIKFAPDSAPRISYSTNHDLKGNNIRGKNYQFKYRYVYDDHEISICSPASKVAISTDIYDFSGKLFSDPYFNNVINISIYLGEINVVSIQLFVRESNTSDWFQLASIKKSNISSAIGTYSYEFSNNESLLAVDQIDINRQYEYLPDLADSQEFIDGKYMTYGGITEGHDLVEIDVDLDVQPTIVATEVAQQGTPFITEAILYSYSFYEADQVGGALGYGSATFTKIYGINTGFEAGQYISIDDGKNQQTYVTVGSDSNPSVLRSHLADFINISASMRATIGYGSAVIISGGIVDPSSEIYGMVPDDEIWVFPLNNDNPNNPEGLSVSMYIGISPSALLAPTAYPSVKLGASHRFGIVYFDKTGAKKSTVNKNKSSEIYVPTLIDLPIDKTLGNGVLAKIKWSINHTPPDWAYSYHWVYAGSSIEWFVQYIISKTSSTTPVIETSSDSNFTYINLFHLNKLQIESPEGVEFTNIGSNVLPYEYKEGDRIRFIMKGINATGLGKQFPVTNVAGVLIDEEILGYETIDVDGVDTPTDRIKINNVSLSPAGVDTGTIVEIYTPKKNSEFDIYYEIGDSYPILNPGTPERAHAGQSINQTFDSILYQTSPAQGIFSKLGSFLVTRKIPFTLTNGWNSENNKLFFAESMQYNDYFESYAFDQGNPNIYDSEARTTKRNTIRRSKAYFEGTLTNGLSTFYYDNYITMTSKWGNITGMESIGGTLKVLFERKQTSIYIGANSLKQAKVSGVDVVVSSDNVFGSQNESEDRFGTMSPESVLSIGRHLYFYDQSNSCIVRDAANGPINISESFKIKTWLEAISPTLIASDYKRIVSGYSAKYEEVWMSFYAELAGVVTLSKTIVFDAREQSTGFRFVDLNDSGGKTVDAYCSLSKELFGYREAELYQFDAGNYREFLGVKYPYLIEFVSNINPATRKIFNAIAVNSSPIWYAKDYGDIFVGSGYQGVQPMSKLFPANFRKKEGVWYAPLNRNARHKTGFYTVDSLYNGEHMRGESLGLKLICESDEETTLHSVIVKCTVSEKTY